LEEVVHLLQDVLLVEVVQIQFFQQLHQQVVVEVVELLLLQVLEQMVVLVAVLQSALQLDQVILLPYHLHKEIMVEVQALITQVVVED
jgi:hypothetical protein